jgi:hypothetical protein
MAAPKKQVYRITSEGITFVGEKENINKLPEEHKEAFFKAAKIAADGQTPPPIKIPQSALKEAGFTTEEEFLETLPKPTPPEPQVSPDIHIPNKAFVDILADKIADKILKKLLGG